MDNNSCPLCNIQYSRKDVMMRHYRNKHGTTHSYQQNTHTYPPPPHSLPPPPPPHTPSPPPPPFTPSPQRKEEHFVIKHPITMTVSEVTSCGKTYFVKQLLQNSHKFIQPTLQRIIWLCKRWQSLYDEIQRNVTPRVEFVQGYLLIWRKISTLIDQ